MKRSVIDIGTNSIKFCLAAGNEDGWSILSDHCDMVRLGEALKATGSLDAQAMERSLSSLTAFVEQSQSAGAGAPLLVATEVLRRAANAMDFIASVKEATGLSVQILSGHQEARLSCQAALTGLRLQDSSVVTFDTGGGSTDFAFAEQGVVTRSQSLPLGTLTLTEQFFATTPLTQGVLDEVRQELCQTLSVIEANPCLPLVAMGGNVTALASVILGLTAYDSSSIHGAKLAKSDVTNRLEDWAAQTLQQRRQTPGLQAGRADVILAGSCIIEAVMTHWQAPSIIVSDRSLRHALLERLFCV